MSAGFPVALLGCREEELESERKSFAPSHLIVLMQATDSVMEIEAQFESHILQDAPNQTGVLDAVGGVAGIP